MLSWVGGLHLQACEKAESSYFLWAFELIACDDHAQGCNAKGLHSGQYAGILMLRVCLSST
jgi:hypothetical protein